VNLLLGRDEVSLDKPDRTGQTPLSRAACNGHEEVVKLLLGRDDVSPDTQDGSGRTPFSCAAENGHAGVMALLQPATPTPHNAP